MVNSLLEIMIDQIQNECWDGECKIQSTMHENLLRK